MLFARFGVAVVAWLALFPSAEGRVNPPRGHFFAIDAGAFGTQLDQRFSGNPDNAGYVSTIAGFLRARGGIRVARRWWIEPSIGSLIPWRSSLDGNAKTFTFQGEMDVAFALTNWLKVSAGPGLHWVFTASSFEEILLNNGTGFSTFYGPGGFSNSLALTTDAGLEVVFSRKLSLSLDVFVASVASRLRRKVHAAITVGYRL